MRRGGANVKAPGLAEEWGGEPEERDVWLDGVFLFKGREVVCDARRLGLSAAQFEVFVFAIVGGCAGPQPVQAPATTSASVRASANAAPPPVVPDAAPREEAERMAAYLLELHQALDMENPAPLDENTSHVIGREWHEIDYRGEGMTWEKQKSIYLPKGIPDFKTEAHLRRFFQVESKAPYFVKLYEPRGTAP